ncbi:MAG TPA: macrolide family glycosyltransferase [Pseudonocardiaceae bacterium]|jgi:MGT family glycosyltransferase|nr:macrolide family glycosyltransferase [Pseudonocardiaceae bacterium]
MAHVAVFNFPAIGHVNPTLGVVAELVRRGHRVTCTATDYFVPAIRSAGAEPVRYASIFGEFYRSPYTAEALRNSALRSLDDAVLLVDAAEEFYRANRPDVILYDSISWAGRFYASKYGIPAIRLFPSYAFNECFSIQERFPLTTFDDDEVVTMLDRVEALLPEYGFEGRAMEFVRTVEKLAIVFMPREFHYAAETFDERFVFVGPCIRDRSAFQGVWRPSEHSTLLVSLGTAATGWPEFFPMALKAFGDVQVVLAVGDHMDVAELGRIPANVDVRRHVPQLDVLRHATAFVTHGGMNSAMEALYFGVPTVVIPQMNEQKATALRIEELGLGRHLAKADTTVTSLRASAAEISTNPEIAKNLAEVKNRIHETNGPITAAEAIEKHLSQARCDPPARVARPGDR